MKDENKTKKQPINELVELRQRIAELEKSETERKQADESLLESEERYRVLAEAAHDFIFIIDRNDKVQYVNSFAAKQLGYRPEEIIGKPRGLLFPHDISERQAHNLKNIFKTGKQAYFEGKIQFPGQVMWAHTCLVPLRNTVGEVIAVLGITRDITDLKQSEEELKRSHKQLHDLSAHLQSVREEERENIAREIHDELGQVLTALKMDVSWLEGKLPPDHTPLLEKTKSILKMIDATIQTVKKICTELRPAMLDHLGLTAAIEWQVKEFEARTGIKCTISLEPEEIILDRDLSTTVFRILQEMLTNVARHAKATKVDVSLEERAGKVVLSVRDNGKGLTKEQIAGSKSFGLIGIKERARHFRGEIKISSIRRKGTTITLSIPHQTVLRKRRVSK